MRVEELGKVYADERTDQKRSITSKTIAVLFQYFRCFSSHQSFVSLVELEVIGHMSSLARLYKTSMKRKLSMENFHMQMLLPCVKTVWSLNIRNH